MVATSILVLKRGGNREALAVIVVELAGGLTAD